MDPNLSFQSHSLQQPCCPQVAGGTERAPQTPSLTARQTAGVRQGCSVALWPDDQRWIPEPHVEVGREWTPQSCPLAPLEHDAHNKGLREKIKEAEGAPALTLMACPKKPFPSTSPWIRSQGRKICCE